MDDNIMSKNYNFPLQYIEDMNRIYNKCKHKNSMDLCDIILKGIENVSLMNKNFNKSVTNVYNDLLKLSKKKPTSLQTENCVAITSRSSITTEKENGINKKSNELFKEFIDKCYKNSNFLNSNITVIDKLYESLPSDFVDTKYFVSLLEEVNQIIWPDSSINTYVNVDHIHDQLMQFQSSMKIQDETIWIKDKKKNNKKLCKLIKLEIALEKVCERIKILGEKEMDINDDDDFGLKSAYIFKNRYEKRALLIFKRICKLRGEPYYLETPKLLFKQTKNSLVNKTIEKFYNITKVFPDYFEIYTLLRLLNKKKKIGWTKTELKKISRDGFIKLGLQLKHQRLNEFFGHLENTTVKDPAELNVKLMKKLNKSNKKLNADLNMVLEKFKILQDNDGSNLNNTDCEDNSESDNKNKHFNKELRNINHIQIRRKRTLSENDVSKKRIIHSEKNTNSATKNIYFNDGNFRNIVAVDQYYTDDEGNSTIVIGETVIKKPLKKKVPEVNNKNSTNEDKCNGSVIEVIDLSMSD